MDLLPCTEETLDAAADLLNRGGVAVIPTDTVYGLAAHPSHPAAVERLYAIKGRDARKPIALLATDADAVTAFGATLPPAAAKLAAERWPGALTLVLPWSGRRPATDAPQALADVGLSADLVIDDGVSPGGVPSTVVKVLPDGQLQTLRP